MVCVICVIFSKRRDFPGNSHCTKKFRGAIFQATKSKYRASIGFQKQNPHFLLLKPAARTPGCLILKLVVLPIKFFQGIYVEI
jgi:hypothetical protein